MAAEFSFSRKLEPARALSWRGLIAVAVAVAVVRDGFSAWA
jgi:hypothetical protein